MAALPVFSDTVSKDLEPRSEVDKKHEGRLENAMVAVFEALAGKFR